MYRFAYIRVLLFFTVSLDNQAVYTKISQNEFPDPCNYYLALFMIEFGSEF
jgi:hypothetical protein